MKRIGLLALLGLSTLAGCGESLTGTYTGTATIVDNTCGTGRGRYNMEAAVRINGNDIDFRITRFNRASSDLPDAATRNIAGVPFLATVTDDVYFNVAEQTYDNTSKATVSADGSISESRDTIDNLDIVLTLQPRQLSRSCVIEIVADKLTLRD